MRTNLKMADPHLCHVCGYKSAGYPWGENSLKPSFEICSCCGTEFGNDDATPKGVRQARAKWMENGYPWVKSELKPKDWEPDIQMGQLKDTLWDPWA